MTISYEWSVPYSGGCIVRVCVCACACAPVSGLLSPIVGFLEDETAGGEERGLSPVLFHYNASSSSSRMKKGKRGEACNAHSRSSNTDKKKKKKKEKRKEKKKVVGKKRKGGRQVGPREPLRAIVRGAEDVVGQSWAGASLFDVD